MASSGGLEPSTVRLEGACSIQLSYEDKAKTLYQMFISFDNGLE